MNIRKAFLLAAILALEAIVIVNSSYSDCDVDPITNTECGSCTGRPHCGGTKRCGNVDDVCFCDCSQLGKYKCRTSGLGLRWNSGAKFPNGTYRFNGVAGDGKHYVC